MTTKNLPLIFIALVLVLLTISQCNAFKFLKEDEICENVNACAEYYDKFVDGIDGFPIAKCSDNLMMLTSNVRYKDDEVCRYCSCIEDFNTNCYHPSYFWSQMEELNIFGRIHLRFLISEHMDCSNYFHFLSFNFSLPLIHLLFVLFHFS